MLFTYLHLAADRELTLRAVRVRARSASPTRRSRTRDGKLPLLAPMSEIAGKIATQAGAFMLEKPFGGRGILLGGVPGVAAATVMIIGGGVVGMNAAFIAIGMEAEVFVFDKSIDRLRELDIALGGRASTVYSSTLAVEEMLPRADLVIGAVLVHGARAPRVIKREQLKLMKPGAVLVDVSIDQGGCFETSRPTTHSDPTYEVDGVLHYCVANMPGAVPITSTYALTNATLPYVLELAEHGVAEARDARSRRCGSGVNVAGGHVTHPAVAESLGLPLVPLDEALAPRCRPRPDNLTTHAGGDTMATAAQTGTEIQNFIDGESSAPADGGERAGPQPGHRRADRDRAAVRRGGRRRRGAGREARLQGVVGDAAGRARATRC